MGLIEKLNELYNIRIRFEKCDITDDMPNFVMITGYVADDFFA